MGIFSAITAITAVAGAVSSFSGAKKQEKAFKNQAALSLQAAEEQAKVTEELAEIEAALFERAGQSGQEIARFNSALAQQNAVAEEQAGLLSLSQARKFGEARVSSMVTGFASQGRLINDTTPNLLIEEGFNELDKDLDIILKNTESRAANARGQANLLTLQGQREFEQATAQAASARRRGEIDAKSLRTTGQISSATSLASAAGARTQGTAALIGGITGFAKALS